MQKIFIVVTIAALSLGYFLFATNEENQNMTQSKPNSKNVVLFKTSLGEIKVELFEDKAPKTVKNFIQYVKDGHYDKTIFHRVIDNFMVQGGGFTDEFDQKATRDAIENEADNGLLNKRGTIAMARTQDVNSATAQFFINVADNDFLDFHGKTPQAYGYCVFGKVIEGMDTLDKIRVVETTTKGSYRDVPAKTVEITSAKML